MSLSSVIPYIRKKMESLGYQEHFDEFDDQNIPATIMDKAFRITPETLTAGPSRNVDYEWTYPLEIEIFFRGYARPSNAVDGAFLELEKLMDALLDVSERYSLTGVRDIYPNNISFTPFSSDNDSIVRARLGLSAKVNIYNSKDCL